MIVNVTTERLQANVQTDQIKAVVTTQKLIAKVSGSIVVVGHGYLHTQTVPSSTWNVNHNLGKYPSVTIITSLGAVIEAAVTYIDENTLTVALAGAATGMAACN